MSTGPAAPKKILVVDDDKAVTVLLESLLSAQGYTVLKWLLTVLPDGMDPGERTGSGFDRSLMSWSPEKSTVT